MGEYHCSSAEEFLELLSPLGKHFKGENLNAPWLFRGHGQEDWPLIPSLFRNSKKNEKLLKRDVKKYDDVIKAEKELLIRFFYIADKRGLVLPEDSQRLRTFFARMDIEDRRIDDEALSIMALSQHYGLPTRLLDWSLNPSIATFFAADDAYKNRCKYKHESRLVVWAFYFPTFGTRLSEDSRCVISDVTAPRATNANLKAQQGVFTLVHEKRNVLDEKTEEYIPLDTLVDRLVDSARANPVTKLSPDDEGNPWLKAKLGKFTLPISEAEYLLYLLAKQDITSSSIYPGYGSIVSDLEMLRAWGEL